MQTSNIEPPLLETNHIQTTLYGGEDDLVKVIGMIPYFA